MPIFSKKFDIKSIPARNKRYNAGCPQIQEKLDEYRTIQINLTRKKLKFIDGTWILTQNSADVDDVGALKRKLQKLEEENNLNRIKVDVLLDMLTENLSEMNLLRNKWRNNIVEVWRCRR